MLPVLTLYEQVNIIVINIKAVKRKSNRIGFCTENSGR
jgi:hypothetical protein